jgi:hypothetical protein
MAEAEPEVAQPKVKVLRRTSISPNYIKADAELQHAATQYLTAIAEFSDKLKQVKEASANLKQKLVPKLGFDGEVDWRVIADERVKVVLSLKRYRRSPPLGCKTDKICHLSECSPWGGRHLPASSRRIARELDARTDRPLARHHWISLVGQRGRLDAILRGQGVRVRITCGMGMDHRPVLPICACVA